MWDFGRESRIDEACVNLKSGNWLMASGVAYL